MLVLQMMLASAGNICVAAVVGFCWWCLDLLLMLVLGGCSDNIAVPKNNENCKSRNITQTHSKTHGNTQSLAQTLQNGGLGASFRHPYDKNEAFWYTLGPQNRQSGPLGTILSAQGPHNEIFGLLLGAKGALWEPFWGPKASKWSLFGTLLEYKWAPWWL